MKLRRGFQLLIIGLSVIIVGTSVITMILFETQLSRVYTNSVNTVSAMFHQAAHEKSAPMIAGLSMQLKGKTEAEQRDIIAHSMSEFTRHAPKDAIDVIISLPNKTILYPEESVRTEDHVRLIPLMEQAAEKGNGSRPELDRGAMWFIHMEKIPETGLWWGGALNMNSLYSLFNPILRFHRYVAVGIICVTLILLVLVQTMTFTFMRKAVRLENEIKTKASDLKQMNLLLNVEVDIRRTIELELKEANAELQILSSIDQLTKISNRRMFDQTLDREWLRHLRDQKELSLILFDVDYFKKYNDTYGHQKGDRALEKIGQILKRSCRRPADLAARYGGEEFCLILPETNRDGAAVIAKSIQKMLKDEPIEHSASEIADHLTLSIGIASGIPSITEKSESLLKAADKAMYKAKERGRNRIET
jgi:diguanylate cyclase (GGDEF)-like protein